MIESIIRYKTSEIITIQEPKRSKKSEEHTKVPECKKERAGHAIEVCISFPSGVLVKQPSVLQLLVDYYITADGRVLKFNDPILDIQYWTLHHL